MLVRLTEYTADIYPSFCQGDLEYTFGVPDGSTVAGSADPGEATPAALDLQPANVASENELQWYPQELTMASTSAQGQNVASTSSNGFTLESSSYAPGLDCHPSTMYHDPSQEEHAFIMAVPDGKMGHQYLYKPKRQQLTWNIRLEWTRLYGQPQQAADAAPRRHRRDKKAAPKGKTSSSHRHD